MCKTKFIAKEIPRGFMQSTPSKADIRAAYKSEQELYDSPKEKIALRSCTHARLLKPRIRHAIRVFQNAVDVFRRLKEHLSVQVVGAVFQENLPE